MTNGVIEGGFEKAYFLGLLFVVGGAIMVLELVGSRIVAPYYGTSIFVWASLIGITLVALAIGYYLGGYLADNYPSERIVYLLVLAAAIWIALMPLFSPIVLKMTNPLGVRLGSFTAIIIIFAIPLLLLGTVTPYAVRFITNSLQVIGESVGELYAISTIGGFFGTMLAGFILIPYFGTGGILFGAAIILAIASGIGFFIEKAFRKLLVLPIIALSLSAAFSYQPEQVLYEKNTLYGQIKVVDIGNMRSLLVDGGMQTGVTTDSWETYTSYSRTLEERITNKSERMLVLGLGGGYLSKAFEKKGYEVQTVEINPEIVYVAEKYFNYKGDVILDDARHYIRNTKSKYDVVLFDAFQGYSPSPHLITKEFFEEVKGVLDEDGVFVYNTLGNADSFLQKSVHRTLKEVFSNVTYESINHGFGNVIFYASMNGETVPTSEGVIITDDYNPTEILFWENNEILRDGSLYIFGDDVLVY